MVFRQPTGRDAAGDREVPSQLWSRTMPPVSDAESSGGDWADAVEESIAREPERIWKTHGEKRTYAPGSEIGSGVDDLDRIIAGGDASLSRRFGD